MPGQSRRTKRRNWNVSFHFGFWHRIPDSGKLQVLCTSHCHRKWRVESGMLHVVNMIFEFLSCRPSLALLPWHCAVILFGSASALRLYVCCQGCVNAHGLCHRAPCIYLPEYVLATALDAPNDQSEEIQFIMLLDYFFLTFLCEMTVQFACFSDSCFCRCCCCCCCWMLKKWTVC